MKKLLFLAGMLILVGTTMSYAGNADKFSYDAVTIENQMAQMNQLEGYLNENPGTTLSDMVTTGNNLADLVSGPNSIAGFNGINEKVLGIPGFLWGCVLSWVGILIVYLVGQDPHETKQAIIGCVVGAVAYAAFYVVYYILILGYYNIT
jgi:hypothetical protein